MGKLYRRIALYLLVVIISIAYLMPIFWMLTTSLKSKADLLTNPPALLPRIPQFVNYLNVFDTINFFRLTGNSLFLAVMEVVGVLFSAPLLAYACSHINWRGGKVMFGLVMATLLLPYQATMIPVFIIWNKLGAIGTFLPLVVPAFLAVGKGYYVFLLRQFMLTIPTSLVQSAKIEGANHFQIYTSIILPLCKSVIATVAVLSFLRAWSDFAGPLIYLNSEKQYTLSLGLYAFVQTNYVEWEKLMAAATMFTLPIIVLFFLAQKQLIEGISLTGIKG